MRPKNLRTFYIVSAILITCSFLGLLFLNNDGLRNQPNFINYRERQKHAGGCAVVSGVRLASTKSFHAVLLQSGSEELFLNSESSFRGLAISLPRSSYIDDNLPDVRNSGNANAVLFMYSQDENWFPKSAKVLNDGLSVFSVEKFPDLASHEGDSCWARTAKGLRRYRRPNATPQQYGEQNSNNVAK